MYLYVSRYMHASVKRDLVQCQKRPSTLERTHVSVRIEIHAPYIGCVILSTLASGATWPQNPHICTPLATPPHAGTYFETWNLRGAGTSCEFAFARSMLLSMSINLVLHGAAGSHRHLLRVG